jgi:hypothetical protein
VGRRLSGRDRYRCGCCVRVDAERQTVSSMWLLVMGLVWGCLLVGGLFGWMLRVEHERYRRATGQTVDFTDKRLGA